MIAFFVPGLRFFQAGQCAGYRTRIPMHLGRVPVEATDPATAEFYRRLLACQSRSEVHQGEWRLLDCRAAWKGNPTAAQFVACSWTGPEDRRLLVAVNYGPNQGQCYVAPGGTTWRVGALCCGIRWGRPATSATETISRARGLYLDLPPWGYHAFRVERR